MWKRTGQTYGATPLPETPYQRAAQVWDDRIGSARVQAASWRYACFGALGLAILSTGALAWRSGQSLVTPYVVELTEDGAVRNVGPASAAYEATDAQLAHHLARFVSNVRSVSIDPVVVRQNWLEAYAYATDKAALTLNEYARTNDPFAELGRRSVAVDMTSVVRSSDDSFELRWRETRYTDGVRQGTATHTAVLSVVIDPPTDEDTLHRNPLGIYVHGINWSKDLTRGER